MISNLDMMAGDEAKTVFASLDSHKMSRAVSLDAYSYIVMTYKVPLLIDESKSRVQISRKQVRQRTFRLLNDQARLDLCLVTGSRLAPSFNYCTVTVNALKH